MKNFRIAPQEQIRFVEWFLPVFLKLIQQPDAWVTDLSSLWDFCQLDADDAEKPGTRLHYFIFRQRIWRKINSVPPFDAQNESDPGWREEVFEARAVPYKKMLIRRILRHTGVDISAIFEENIPVVIQYIATRISEDHRTQLLRRFGSESEEKRK